MRLSFVRLSALAACTLAPVALAAQTPAPNAAPAAPVVAAPAAAPTNARPALRSWLSDRRDFVVGDIITVLVDDYTITSAIKDDLASQKRSRDLSLGVNVSSGTAGKNISARINPKNNGDSQNRGEARRENRFQSEMSVRVVALGSNGTLQISGTRLIDVDKGKQDVALTGWIRPQDISTANVIESSRVADARLTYLSPGELGKTKESVISRVIGMVWP